MTEAANRIEALVKPVVPSGCTVDGDRRPALDPLESSITGACFLSC
jgi:hypothetical protein